MLPTAFIAVVIIFSLTRFLPGDTAAVMLGSEGGSISESQLGDLRHELGLDRPLVAQFGSFAAGVVRGDLGRSFWSKQPAFESILARLPVTLELLILAVVFSAIWGISIGTMSALWQDSFWDYLFRTVAIGALSIPTFWMAIMIVLLPAIWFGWSPVSEYTPFSEGPITNLRLFLLPALILGLHLGAPIMRLTRTMVLEVIRQDYIRTAHAKGLSGNVVLRRHVLKNAMLPVVTVLGLQLAGGIGGTVILEQIFRLPGMGNLFLVALTHRDYAIIQAFCLLLVMSIMVVNLLVDLAYGLLDPRIRVS